MFTVQVSNLCKNRAKSLKLVDMQIHFHVNVICTKKTIFIERYKKNSGKLKKVHPNVFFKFL